MAEMHIAADGGRVVHMHVTVECFVHLRTRCSTRLPLRASERSSR